LALADSRTTDTPIVQFTPGDFLVMRGGDSTNPDNPGAPDYGGEVNCYIDEYSQAGYYVGTLDLPEMTLPGGGGNSLHEGNLDISPNGQWVAFAGYDPQTAGSSDVASPVGPTEHPQDGTETGVIGEINLAAGPSSLNASTLLLGSSNFPNNLTGQFVHSAMTIDGNEFYIGGKYNETDKGGSPSNSDTGLIYINGVGPNATDTVLEGGTDWRNILDFNGQLYGGTGSSSVGAHGAYAIGTGLPTTPIPTNTNITNYSGGQSASSLAFVKLPNAAGSTDPTSNANVLYTVGDQSVPGITKYYYDSATQTWNDAAAQVPLVAGLTNNINNPVDIVATVDPTNPAWVDLTVSGLNGIFTYIDTSGSPTTGIPANAFTNSITPQSDATFYGMTQDPGSANLVWGKTGNGQNWDVGTSSNWTYAGSNTKFANGYNVTFDDSSNNPQVTLNTVVQPGSVTFEASANNYSITGTGSISGSGSLRLLPGNTSTVTLSTANSYSGGTVVSGGKFLIEPTSSSTTALGRGLLAINNTGVVQLANNVTAGSRLAASNVILTSLSIAGNGTLDIGNNRIIIDYSSPATDPIASIAAWIHNGFYGLSGPSIISSDIAADNAASGNSYGIGYADGADGAVAGLPSGEIEIMFTLLGDANLDGTVNSEDFTPFSHNLNQNGGWDQGDFNYDGTVNAEDFTPFSHNLNQSAVLAASAGVLASSVQFSSISLTNVPEPGSMGLVTLIAGGLLVRRKRNSNKSNVISCPIEMSSTEGSH
jgi:autotransporter-associated beta strand protein